MNSTFLYQLQLEKTTVIQTLITARINKTQQMFMQYSKYMPFKYTQHKQTIYWPIMKIPTTFTFVCMDVYRLFVQYMWIASCICMCVVQWPMYTHLPNHFPPYFLRKSFTDFRLHHFGQNGYHQALIILLCLSPQSRYCRIIPTCLGFYLGCGNLNSGFTLLS